jgi:deoxyribonuclease V
MSSFSVKKARAAQCCLSKKAILDDRLPSRIQTLGGIDVSYVGDLGIGAATVLNYDTLEPLEAAVAVCRVKVPYIPTLLSFREIPPAVSAVRKLHVKPDVLLVDAQGWAHPYRCGFATHLGIVMATPTVGAAKSRLIGEPNKLGERTLLIDEGEVIGEVVTTKQGSKPIYISVGHMVSLETAVKIVRHCSKSRIPEPLRLAHKLATQTRLELQGKAK